MSRRRRADDLEGAEHHPYEGEAPANAGAPVGAAEQQGDAQDAVQGGSEEEPRRVERRHLHVGQGGHLVDGHEGAEEQVEEAEDEELGGGHHRAQTGGHRTACGHRRCLLLWAFTSRGS